MLIEVTDQSIDAGRALDYVRHRSCGAVAFFEGDIRETNEGEAVISLEYEVYEALFRKVVSQIAAEIKDRWAVHEIAVIQRSGHLQIGDAGIVIAVSSPHRREALEAVAYLIEEFKKRVPVWKKEHRPGQPKWINWEPQLPQK